MALPSNREQLKEWCLKKLGKPVIKINVSNEQLEDRIDEAIERFQEHHFDGVVRTYLKHQVTASRLKFNVPLGFQFLRSEIIVGQTSGAKGIVFDQAEDNLSVRFMLDVNSAAFIPGETVVTPSGSANLSSDSDAIVLGDKDNGYIPIDDGVVSVTQMISMPGIFGGGLFSFTFQQALSALPIWPKGNLNYYYAQRRHLQLIEEIFIGNKVVTFNRMMNRLYIDLDWRNMVAVDDWFIIEAYVAVNPETWKKVYANHFLLEYTTALIKEQWGTNLSKFDTIVLPSGAKLNGSQIVKEAKVELAELRRRLKDEFQTPPRFFMG